MKHLTLFFAIFAISLAAGCACVKPNDKDDLSQGFYTYGFGRDIEVEFYETGKVKKIKATSNIGSTIKGAEKVLSDVSGLAQQVIP